MNQTCFENILSFIIILSLPEKALFSFGERAIHVIIPEKERSRMNNE